MFSLGFWKVFKIGFSRGSKQYPKATWIWSSRGLERAGLPGFGVRLLTYSAALHTFGAGLHTCRVGLGAGLHGSGLGFMALPLGFMVLGLGSILLGWPRLPSQRQKGYLVAFDPKMSKVSLILLVFHEGFGRPSELDFQGVPNMTPK